MKKIITIGAVIAGLIFGEVSAATVATLSSSAATVAPGQTFTVSVSVNPNGTENYVEKVELSYSPDILEVRSFVLASNWTALTQAGYDSTDNGRGILVKSAGYPNGISANTLFGTVTFFAKKAGSASIEVGSGSLAYEEKKQTRITGNTLSVSVASVQTPVPTAIAKQTVRATPFASISPVPSSSVTPSPEAQAAAAVLGGNGKVLPGIIILLILIALGYAIRKFLKTGKARRS